VLKVNGSRARRQNVALGLRGEGWAEIRAGLDEGDLVVPADNVAIKPGRRVRTAVRD
jgi:hypothetical protein